MSQIPAVYVCDVGDDSPLPTLIHLNLHLGICYTFGLFLLLLLLLLHVKKSMQTEYWLASDNS